MDGVFYTAVTHIHGQLAALSLAVLLHPVLWLRPGRSRSPRIRWTSRLGVGGLLATYALGWWAYPTYRSEVKPALVFADGGVSPDIWVALRFETKEHLAVLALSLALAGLAVLELGGPGEAARRTGRVLLGCAVALGALVAGLGMVVGAFSHPGF